MKWGGLTVENGMQVHRGFPVNCLGYLATPYASYPDGRTKAFVAAAHLASRLLKEGLKVYCPIAHSHPIALYGGLDPFDYDIWLPFDEALMQVCDALLVAHLPGWQDSVGMAHEVTFFEGWKKRIFDLDPATLAVTLR